MSQDDESLANSLDATKQFLGAERLTAPPASKEGTGGADRQLTEQRPTGQPVSAEEQARIRRDYTFDPVSGLWLLKLKVVARAARVHGLKPEHVIGCGMCLQRAIHKAAVARGCKDFKDWQALRDAAGKVLRTANHRRLNDFVETNTSLVLPDNWRETVKPHFEGREWGCNIAMAVYAFLLKVDIQVWNAADASRLPMICGGSLRGSIWKGAALDLVHRADDTIPMYNESFVLVGRHDGHFDILLPSGNSQASVQD